VTLGFFPVKRPEGVSTSMKILMKIAYHARILTRIIGDRASFASCQPLLITTMIALRDLHTGTMFIHLLRLNVSARPNLVMFYSRCGSSGSVFMFEVIDARLMINTFSAWYS
jgi:hypothetical protein